MINAVSVTTSSYQVENEITIVYDHAFADAHKESDNTQVDEETYPTFNRIHEKRGEFLRCNRRND